MQGEKKMFRKLTLSLVALIMMLAAFVTAQPVAAETSLQCSDHTLNVTLAPDSTDTYQVVGTLCSQGPVAGKTIQLLLHGITYARYYWDLPYQSEHYSYVHSATKRGYATFNLDRIGNGASDHPADSSLVDLDSNAYVVHQVVEALRAGQVGSTSFAKVIVVGHSMGSMVTARYASSYPGEANGIILTGLLHSINWNFAYASLIPNLYPALLDPKFAGQFSDPYYLTTIPGTRTAFYYLPNTDPQVVMLDESLKQVVTMAEFQTGPSVVYDQSSLQITGPVLMVVGQYDYLFCGPEVNFNCSDKASVQAYEETKFSASACLETEVINDAGHDLNLHMNANATYSQMLSWADRHVGSTADLAPEPCEP
jgi:pimeloyl-ACP methyl ester carboxylesterase